MATTQHYFLPTNDSLNKDWQLNPTLFDPAHLRQQKLIHQCKTAGRGEVVFFKHKGHSLVLRHYRRGGLAARLSDDRYIWLGIESSRPWREYRLLEWMRYRNLPAPRAYAAHVHRTGLLYSGDLISHEIDNALSMADQLSQEQLSPDMLARIGSTIRHFHTECVDHVDLNANNILIDANEKVWLIDFDRCRIRANADGGWRQSNLLRLQRSLSKLQVPADNPFSIQHWHALISGYESM